MTNNDYSVCTIHQLKLMSTSDGVNISTSKLSSFLILVTDKTLSVLVVVVINTFEESDTSLLIIVVLVSLAEIVSEPIEVANVAEELAIGWLEIVSLFVLIS